jgi:ATP-dependent RNA helicase HelY
LTLSPSERFAKSSEKKKFGRSTSFANRYPFELDDFQINGCHALEAGESVLVAAPTGSGKTLVGEFAIFLALETGKKAFYTTPIKALSNQKYQDLVSMFGTEKVGLLTGDNSINSEAPVVVMTTEVLRNMLYANSSTLQNLGFVVMDEVHYLADRFRGAVWEETLIHLPESVQIAALSATVSNAEEFGDWLHTIRGNTKVIVTEKRPVPLYQHVLMGNKLLELFNEDGKVNPQVLREERASFRNIRRDKWREDRSERLTRPEVIERLDREHLLPVIVFIFSRGACDQAVKQCLHSGLRLTSKEEKEEILAFIEDRVVGLSEADLSVLGFSDWCESLSRGVAAHHAGLLPIFKEIIEDLFQKNLIKVVFATETLALGINMPARTVLLERLSKWNGEGHVPVTPGEYTQLTGRAGRRGIDIEGNAVILWSNDIDASTAAGLASTRTYPLRSSFKPTYNMTVNLVHQMGRERARTSLGSSFAQFQADKAVVGISNQILKNKNALESMKGGFECHLGDFFEYAKLRSDIKEIEKNLKSKNRRARVIDEELMERLRNELRHHPCHPCSDREKHAREAEKYFRLFRESKSLEDRVAAKTNVIPRQFDAIADILNKRGYVAGDEITPEGKILAKIYAEMDLVIAESFRAKLFNDFNPAELASVLSIFLFESRKENPIRVPNVKFQERVSEVAKIWLAVHEDEEDAGLAQTKSIDLGFAWGVFRWASGSSLQSVLNEADMSIGDFIRAIKQIIDLLRQLQIAFPDNRDTFIAAIKLLDKGIITSVSGN